MRQTLQPELEYNRRPVLWGAVTMFLIGFIVNFVVIRPGWLVSGAFIAGGVAAARSGFYEPSGNNGALSVMVGMVPLLPLLAINRTVLWFGIENIGDRIFLSSALALGFVTITAMIVVPVGYIGATVIDTVRKRVGGPIGY